MKVGETHHFLIKKNLTTTTTPTLFFKYSAFPTLEQDSQIWQEMAFVPEKRAEFTAKMCFPAILKKYVLISMGQYFLCHF